MLGDAAVRMFSRTQMEEVLDKRKAGTWRRRLCYPFLHSQDALSLTCSLLAVMAVGLYYGWGLTRWEWQAGDAWLIAGLTLPLLGAAIVVNILARYRTEEVLHTLVPFLWLLTAPVRPLGLAIVRLEEWIHRAGGRDVEEEETEDREEILAAVTDGEHEGVVAEGEREMIVNIFDLKNFDIRDIMTPRTEICAIEAQESLQAAVALALREGYTRIPVFQDTRDNIKGIFHVKDALDYWRVPTETVPSLKSVMRQPLFVPETKSVADLMTEMQDKKAHIAVVLDEYGGTAGLVTMEDIVEEIVGEIQDEYDMEEGVRLRELGPGRFEMDARTHVHDVNEALGERVLPETEDYETLGGFVLDQLGHVPQPGETFAWEALRFTILAATERRIERIRVEGPSTEEQVAPEREDLRAVP